MQEMIELRDYIKTLHQHFAISGFAFDKIDKLLNAIEKANPVENLVSQAASQAMPEPNVSCENCKHWTHDEDDMPDEGFCYKLASPSNNNSFWCNKNFYCKQFEQK